MIWLAEQLLFKFENCRLILRAARLGVDVEGVEIPSIWRSFLRRMGWGGEIGSIPGKGKKGEEKKGEDTTTKKKETKEQKQGNLCQKTGDDCFPTVIKFKKKRNQKKK